MELQQAEWQQLREKLESTRLDYLKNEHDLEEVVGEEITELRLKYELMLNEERQNTALIQVENQTIRTTYDSFLKTIQGNKKQMQARQDELRKLQTNIQRLQLELENFKKERVDRDASVIERDKNIQEERRHLQDIEKAKFILENRITSEKEQLEPREKLCQTMREQTQAMNQELQFLKDGRKEKKIAIRRLENRLAAIHKQWNREKQRTIGFQVTMGDIAEHFHEILKGAGLVSNGSTTSSEKGSVKASVLVDQRLKKALIDFYHQQCDLKGTEQLRMQPKGYMAQMKLVGDPLITQVMDVPFAMERMSKEPTSGRASPSKMSKSDNSLNKSFASSRDQSVTSSQNKSLDDSNKSQGTEVRSSLESFGSKSKSTTKSSSHGGSSRDDLDSKRLELESTINLVIPSFERHPETHSTDVERVRSVLKATVVAGPNATKRTLLEEVRFQRNFQHEKMAACHWQSHKIKEQSLREKRTHVKEQEILLAEHNQLKRDHEAYVEKVLGKFPAWAEERTAEEALKAEEKRKAQARLPVLAKSRL